MWPECPNIKPFKLQGKSPKARFDSRKEKTETETILNRKLARSTQDNFAALQACDPPMPPSAYNRVADNWRPLFAIAYVAGGDWPALALEAYNLLTARRTEEPPVGRVPPRGVPSAGRGEGPGNAKSRSNV